MSWGNNFELYCARTLGEDELGRSNTMGDKIIAIEIPGENWTDFENIELIKKLRAFCDAAEAEMIKHPDSTCIRTNL